MEYSVFDAAAAGGLGGLILAAILIGLTNPWQYALASEESEGHDATDPAGLAGTPIDDPMRSPDYCWGHGKIEKKEN